MGGMTVCAHRCYGKPALHETLAVRALSITFYDLVLVTGVPYCGFLSLAVAAGAEIGNIRRERSRLRIDFSLDTVRPVTFFAGWSIGVVLAREPAMDTHDVLLPDLRMARRAINFLFDRLARP